MAVGWVGGQLQRCSVSPSDSGEDVPVLASNFDNLK